MEDKNRELNAEELEQGVGGIGEWAYPDPATKEAQSRAAEEAIDELAKKTAEGWKTAERQQAPVNNSMVNKGIDWW